MGSIGTPFARNVEFETTFPDQGKTTLTQNRHGGRLGLLTPDPQVISRILFTRAQSNPQRATPDSGFLTIRRLRTAITRRPLSLTFWRPIGFSS